MARAGPEYRDPQPIAPAGAEAPPLYHERIAVTVHDPPFHAGRQFDLAAVRDHGFSATDFAPTDLAIELLLLLEAKAGGQGGGLNP